MTSQHDHAQLISGLIDGTLSDDDTARLTELLRDDPDVRAEYLDMIYTDSTLGWCSTANLIDLDRASLQVAELSPASAPALSTRRQLLTLRLSLAAMVMVCASLVVLLLSNEGSSVAVAEGTSEGGVVAVITDTQDAQWEATRLPTRVGAPLAPGWLKLKRGRAHLDFLDGTTVVLEGPAELGLNSVNRAFLKSGTLSVQAGPNRAFVVETSSLRTTATDSQFGIAVDAAGSAEVHVFAGSAVVASHDDASEVTLAENEALAASGDSTKQMTRKAADAGAFVLAAEMPLQDVASTKDVLRFHREQLLPYGFQDGQYVLPTECSVHDEGRTIQLSGNAWKTVELNLNLTRNTVIEFEFRSTREGQIHGFGFDNDNFYHNSEPVFQIHGYEVLKGIGQQFNDYSPGGWKRFRIRVGRYVTGPRRFLYFAADDDVTAHAESFFRNVRIYEASE